MEYRVKVLAAVNQNQNIKHFILEKPDGYSFTPGQSTEISLDSEKMKQEKRPYAITCTAGAPNLEIMAKVSLLDPFAAALQQVQPGDHIIIRPASGNLEYKGPGYFIAGGTGITPFISILKQLEESDSLEGNHLIYSTKASETILERELKKMLGNNIFINYTNATGRIDKTLIEGKIASFRKHFYICGPELMVENMRILLQSMGVPDDRMVFESCYNFGESQNAA